MVRLLEALPQLAVVVDLAIDSEDDGVVGIGQGLGARFCWWRVSMQLVKRMKKNEAGKGGLPTPTILSRSWHKTAHHVSPGLPERCSDGSVPRCSLLVLLQVKLPPIRSTMYQQRGHTP